MRVGVAIMENEKQIKKWIRRIKRSSDKKAANELVSYYYDEIYGYIYKRVDGKETALDITQEVLVSCLESIKNYDDKKSSFATWLYQITNRRITDYYRSRSYWEDRILELPEEEGLTSQDLDGEMIDRFELEEIYDFIDSLGDNCRKIFELKIFEACTFKEIGEKLDMPESTVKTIFYKTQRKIKTQFDGSDYSGKTE